MLRIFVGATTDLEAERAVIGRSVAELPVKIGIEIRRTPPLLPTTDEIVARLDGVDRVYFLMGNDISAPAGLEWHIAWQLQRSVLPLRNSPRPTPAALEFFRLAPAPWHNFRSQTELARLVSLDLARLLHQLLGIGHAEADAIDIVRLRLHYLVKQGAGAIKIADGDGNNITHAVASHLAAIVAVGGRNAEIAGLNVLRINLQLSEFLLKRLRLRIILRQRILRVGRLSINTNLDCSGIGASFYFAVAQHRNLAHAGYAAIRLCGCRAREQ